MRIKRKPLAHIEGCIILFSFLSLIVVRMAESFHWTGSFIQFVESYVFPWTMDISILFSVFLIVFYLIVLSRDKDDNKSLTEDARECLFLLFCSLVVPFFARVLVDKPFAESVVVGIFSGMAATLLYNMLNWLFKKQD